jgi:AcrR family transcriptional regulator
MTDKQVRLKPEVRRDDILAAAFALAAKGHYQHLTRNQVAEAAGISGPAVLYHFKSMDKLRKAIMRAAIAREFLPVVVQGVVAHDPLARGLPGDLKARAMASVS